MFWHCRLARSTGWVAGLALGFADFGILLFVPFREVGDLRGFLFDPVRHSIGKFFGPRPPFQVFAAQVSSCKVSIKPFGPTHARLLLTHPVRSSA